MTVISLIVFLVIFGLAFYALGELAGPFNIPAPIVAVIRVVIVIFAVLAFLQMLGVGVGPTLRLN